jgi:hypothetical protein
VCLALATVMLPVEVKLPNDWDSGVAGTSSRRSQVPAAAFMFLSEMPTLYFVVRYNRRRFRRTRAGGVTSFRLGERERGRPPGMPR